MLYKSSFALVLSLFIFIVSCTKSSNNVQPKINSKVLPGSWEQRGFWGPLIDVDPEYYKPGNGNIWSFSDSLFLQRSNVSVYDSGFYSISNTGLNPVENRTISRFVFNHSPAQSFELRNDTLFIFSTQTDQFSYEAAYIKISDDISFVSGH